MMDNSYHVTVTTMQNKQSVIQVFTFVIPYGSDSSAHLKSRIIVALLLKMFLLLLPRIRLLLHRTSSTPHLLELLELLPSYQSRNP